MTSAGIRPIPARTADPEPDRDVTEMSGPGVPRSGTLAPVADPARPDFAEPRRRIRQEGCVESSGEVVHRLNHSHAGGVDGC